MLRFGAFAADVAAFDAVGFRLARAEAAAMDPQARVLLHSVADARQVLPRSPFMAHIPSSTDSSMPSLSFCHFSMHLV